VAAAGERGTPGRSRRRIGDREILGERLCSMNSPAGCPLAPDSVTSADTMAFPAIREEDLAAAAGTLLAKGRGAWRNGGCGWGF